MKMSIANIKPLLKRVYYFNKKIKIRVTMYATLSGTDTYFDYYEKLEGKKQYTFLYCENVHNIDKKDILQNCRISARSMQGIKS